MQDDDDLESGETDKLAAITRGVTSLVPMVGGLLGELITAAIPNQRADRIAKYLKELNERIETLEATKQSAVRDDPERIDLIELGGYQAARATTDDRISKITEVVFSGLSGEDADIVRRKRLLNLLGQVDSDELLLLNAYGQSYGGSGDEAWDKVNRPEYTHLGSDTDALDKEALFEASRENLLRLGLLEQKFPTVKKGELPPFDHFKKEFKTRTEVSYLGRLLLREIKMPSSIDVEDEPA